MGYIPEQKRMYKALKSYGFELIFKPITRDRAGKVKGNVDAELVLHSARVEHDNYDLALIISGDGDFYCLIDYLLSVGKLKHLVIPNMKTASRLLRKFEKFRVLLEANKKGLIR